MQIEKIKVYQMNDCDWVAAESPEQALETLAETFGYESAEDYLEDYNDARETIKEVSAASMQTMIFTGEDDETGEKYECSFAEQLRKLKKVPDFFASTEQ